MTSEQASEILRKARYWHYAFKFPWGETVPGKPGWKERREKRHRHFFLPLLEQYGGALKGKHVLDLGCCQGYWSFEARKAGAESVLGLDSSLSFVQEAQAAATVLGIDACSFAWAHLEEDAWWEDFPARREITLFLGTLFHLTDPIYVLRRVMRQTLETIVIDGEVAAGEEPRFHLRKRTPGEPTTVHSGMTSDIRTIGTVSAITALLKDGGFAKVRVLPPSKEMPPDYHAGTTVSIIASRS
jgi:SAM-dependent methyltransferase